MKRGDFSKLNKSPELTLNGQPLMDFLECGKRGEVAIYSMSCITGRNGFYKISYHESNNKSRDNHGHNTKS